MERRCLEEEIQLVNKQKCSITLAIKYTKSKIFSQLTD